MELLASINYTKQNKNFITFITQKNYCTEEKMIQKSTKLMWKKISLRVRFAERTDTWWQKMLSPDATDNYWRNNFRMNKEDFFLS